MLGMTGIPRPAKRLTTSWAETVDDHVISIGWLPSDTACAVGDVAGGLTVFNRQRGERLMRIQAHAHGLTALAVDPQGDRVATCGQDGVVRVWDTRTAQPVEEVEAGAAWAEQVAWSHDGTLLACAAGKLVRVWNRDGALVREFGGHRATVTDIQWHPSERLLCSTSYGGVTLLDPAQGTPPRMFAWQGSSLVARWSPSGRYIATGEQDSTVHFWIVSSGRDLQMSGYPTKVRALAWSSRDRLLATGGGQAVTVWDCSGRGPAGTKPIVLPGHERPVSAVAFRKGDDLLASGGEDGRVVVWKPAKEKKLVGATQVEQPVSHALWSKDGGALLIGGANGEVRLIDGSGL